MQDKEYSFSGTLSDIKKEIEQLEKIQSYESRIEYMQKELCDIESYVSNWANEIGVDTFNCITPLDYIQEIRKSIPFDEEAYKEQGPVISPEFWQKGDILKVTYTDPGDPVKAGDLVFYADPEVGSIAPFVRVKNSGKQIVMCANQLAFVRRPN